MTDQSPKKCDWLLQTAAAELQKEGIQLMLDCKWEEARIVFEQGRELNPALAGAHCMVLLMVRLVFHSTVRT